MSIEAGKAEVKRMAALLDADHESAEEAARAALDLAWEMYEAKAKYVVIAQIRGALAEGTGETHLDTVVLGPYSTPGKATAAGRSVAIGAPTHEECKWMLAQRFDGSPNAWYLERKERDAAEANAGRLTQAERLIEWLKARGDI